MPVHIKLAGPVGIQHPEPYGEQLHDLPRKILIGINLVDRVRLAIAKMAKINTHHRVCGHVVEQIAVIAKGMPDHQIIKVGHPNGFGAELLGSVGRDQDFAQRESHPLAQRIGHGICGGIRAQLRRAHRTAPPGMLLPIAVQLNGISIHRRPVHIRLHVRRRPGDLIIDPPAETHRHHILHVLRDVIRIIRRILVGAKRRLDQKACGGFDTRIAGGGFVFQREPGNIARTNGVAGAGQKGDANGLGGFSIIGIRQRIEFDPQLPHSERKREGCSGGGGVIHILRRRPGKGEIHCNGFDAALAPNRHKARFGPTLAHNGVKSRHRDHTRRIERIGGSWQIKGILPIRMIAMRIESQPTLLRIG